MTCIICEKNDWAIKKQPCTHSYCAFCLEQMAEATEKVSCPICRIDWFIPEELLHSLIKTKDIEKRLQEHQNGAGANHTKKRLPVILVYYEKYDCIDTAFYREKQVQGWTRAKKEALINGEVDVLHILSECQNETHWLEQYSSAFDSSGECGTSRRSGTTVASMPRS